MRPTQKNQLDKKRKMMHNLFARQDEETARMILRQNSYLTKVVSGLMMLVETGFLIWSIQNYGIFSLQEPWTNQVIAQRLYLVVALYSGIVCIYLQRKNTGHRLFLEAYYIVLLLFGIVLSAIYQEEGRSEAVLILTLICTFGVTLMHPWRVSITSAITFLVYVVIYYQLGCFRWQHALNVMEIQFFLNIIGLVKYYTLREYIIANHKLERYTHILEGLSFTDELTGIGNRNALSRDWNGFVGNTYSVCVVDVDDFKKYNDTYGHGTGDFVLQTVAKELGITFGEKNVYRLGGDEFLIITEWEEKQTTDGLMVILEKLSHLTNEGQVLGVGLSIGCVRGTCRNDADMGMYMNKADAVLYRVKEQGKGAFAYENLLK
ncbi:diguanylate cyclase (GGDEF) domain-containing protein [Lachnospiraceae bacterium XBB1006]|nr:diguanylate cyclase (GGDEF) domain-containing protein [Lachnospiraceae bacterium XBB1006]